MKDQENKYQMDINKIYDKYLTKKIEDYEQLIIAARNIYNEIYNYNRNYSNIHVDGKDDILIYYIACYLKKVEKYKEILSSYGIADVAYKISLGLR